MEPEARIGLAPKRLQGVCLTIRPLRQAIGTLVITSPVKT